MRRLWLILVVLVFLLASCVPAGNLARGVVNAPDGASVEYLSDGVGFDPGVEVALGTILVVTGERVVVYRAPDNPECVQQSDIRWDCALGDVVAPVVVRLSGEDILAIATFRRSGSNVVYNAIGE